MFNEISLIFSIKIDEIKIIFHEISKNSLVFFVKTINEIKLIVNFLRLFLKIDVLSLLGLGVKCEVLSLVC